MGDKHLEDMLEFVSMIAPKVSEISSFDLGIPELKDVNEWEESLHQSQSINLATAIGLDFIIKIPRGQIAHMESGVVYIDMSNKDPNYVEITKEYILFAMLNQAWIGYIDNKCIKEVNSNTVGPYLSYINEMSQIEPGMRNDLLYAVSSGFTFFQGFRLADEISLRTQYSIDLENALQNPASNWLQLEEVGVNEDIIVGYNFFKARYDQGISPIEILHGKLPKTKIEVINPKNVQ